MRRGGTGKLRNDMIPGLLVGPSHSRYQLHSSRLCEYETCAQLARRAHIYAQRVASASQEQKASAGWSWVAEAVC